jgi:hypothetical protein
VLQNVSSLYLTACFSSNANIDKNQTCQHFMSVNYNCTNNKHVCFQNVALHLRTVHVMTAVGYITDVKFLLVKHINFLWT